MHGATIRTDIHNFEMVKNCTYLGKILRNKN